MSAPEEVSTLPAAGRASPRAVALGGRAVESLGLFTLNISGPSMSRADRLFDYLASVDADALVLTETRGTPGAMHLLDRLRGSGYAVVDPGALPDGERGVAIVHRLPTAAWAGPPTADLAHRLVVIRLTSPIKCLLVGTYVPSRDASPSKIERKQTFLTQMVAFLSGLEDAEDIILMGDFNVVSESHVPRYSSFRRWEYASLVDLAARGLVDAFLHLHPHQHVYSWFGRTGSGYRYDYGFVSASLQERVLSCEYIDHPRHLGVSDHSGVLMRLAVARGATAKGRGLSHCRPSPGQYA